MRRERQLLLLATACAIGIGAYTKARAVPTMVTLIDDVGVATTTLRSQAVTTPDAIRTSLARPGHDGPLAFTLRVVSKLGGAPLIARLTSSLSIVTESTYAPAQYLITGFLLHDGLSYQRLLVRGRLPSALFGMLAPLLLAFVAYRMGGAAAAVRALVATTIVACSWELIIHSSQMEPYALGLLAAVVMIGVLLSRPEHKPTTRAALLEGVAVGVLPWCNYQMLFLLPAYAVARGWVLHRQGARWQELVRYALLVGGPVVISVALLYRYFLFRNAGLGVAWNAGPHGEFLFTLPSGTVLAQLTYALKFFAKNSVLVVTAMTAFIPESSRASLPIGCLIAALTGAGAWTLWRSALPRGRTLVLFAVVAAFTWTAMVLKGSLTLSPTRHLMLFLPLFALFAAEAVAALAVKLKNETAVGLGAFALMVVPHLATFDAELNARRNLMSELVIGELIAKSGPDFVITYNCTSDLVLMSPLSIPLFDRGCTPAPGYGRLVGTLGANEPTRILLINSTAPFSASDFPDVMADISATLKRRVVTHRLDEYEQTTVWRVDRPAGLNWTRRVSSGAGGYFATLLVLKSEPRAPAAKAVGR